MKKWSKLLAVPMVLSMFAAGCADDQATGEETEEVAGEETSEETTESSESSSEETTDESSEEDATSEATADEESSDADSEATPGGSDIAEGSSTTPEEAYESEDIEANGEAEQGTTIQDADMSSEEWVEEAAEATDAVEGDTYVELDRGVLTVDQIDEFLKSMPVELTYADDNNQFLYYNYHTEAEDMLGAREPGQVGSALDEVHPESAYQNLAWVVDQLRSGEQELVRMAVPAGDEDQFVVHDYYGIYDDEGNYMGVNEIIHDIMPHVDFYLEETGQELTGGEETETDADSEATADEEGSEENNSEESSPGEGEASATPEEALEEEDISAEGEAEQGTTVSEADMSSDEWVEEAAEATDTVEGDTYVELDRGVLTVEQIDEFLKAMPVELTYADDNNQFLYYNYHTEAEDMLGAREPGQVGSALDEVHPESAYQNLAWVVNQLRTGEQEVVRMAVPAGDEDQFVVHDYYGIYDDEGNYMGVNEIIHDIMPHVDFYLEETGQELTGGDDTDTDSGATPEEDISEEDTDE